MAFCANCGAQLGEGARFCVRCGTPVASMTNTVPVPNSAQPQNYAQPQTYAQPQYYAAPAQTYAQPQYYGAPQQAQAAGMRTADEIVEFVRTTFNISKANAELTRKSAEALLAELMPNEYVEFATDAMIIQGDRLNVFVGATNRRIIIMFKNNTAAAMRNAMHLRKTANGITSYPYEQISSVDFSKGLMSGTITLDTVYGLVPISVYKAFAETTYKSLRNIIYAHKQ